MTPPLNMRKVLIILVIISLVILCAGKKHKNKKHQKQLLSLSQETNPANFARLVIMRLIYGLASTMGLEENISGVLNGAFVPPGVENDDYGDYSDALDF